MGSVRAILFFLLTCILYLPFQDSLKVVAEEIVPQKQEAFILPQNSSNSDIVSVKILPESLRALPGKPFWFYVQFDISPDWHLYWKNPGDAGKAPSIEWTLPDGFQAGEVFWPAPERFEIGDDVVFGYSHQLVLLASVEAPKDLKDGSRVKIGAKVHWLGCSSSCVPGDALFSMNFLASERRPPIPSDIVELFQQAKRQLPVVTKAKSWVQDGSIIIHISPQMSVDEISKVWFFPEEPGLIDTKLIPTWHVDPTGSTIEVRISTGKPIEKSTLPIKGVLVIRDGLKTVTWDVQIPNSVPQAKQVNPKWESQQHIEELEKSVWYRKILDDFRSFTSSDFFNILLGAFFGGILLNLMPCVLPVISLKLLHLVQLQGTSKKESAKHGIIYSIGVIVSFWLLSGTIFILQSFGKSVGWGFQLQEPLFVASLTIILFIFSLNLFGVFEFLPSLSSFAGTLEERASHQKTSSLATFFSGVLATLVASPCTGPLLGSVIGFTAVLEPFRSFVVFTVLGIGMAFPFLLVCLFPPAAKLIPRPGNWMITFKQLMGFFMLATCLWLIWVLSAQTVGLTVITMLSALFFIAFGVWIYGTWGALYRSKGVRRVAKVLAFLIIVVGSYILLKDVLKTEGIKTGVNPEISQVVGQDWEGFSQPLLERRSKRHIPVFVSVTAKWCLTCQANHLVLESDRVKQAFIDYGVTKMEADWTMNDPEITSFIKSLGRNGVPLSVVYSKNPNITPRILPEVLTPEIVIQALKWASEGNDP